MTEQNQTIHTSEEKRYLSYQTHVWEQFTRDSEINGNY